MPPATRRLTSEQLARLQLRIVRVVYRGESQRLDGRGMPQEARDAALQELGGRSLQLLDLLRSSLDRREGWHTEVIAELADLEREIRG